MKNTLAFMVLFFHHLKSGALRFWAFLKTNDVSKLFTLICLTLFNPPQLKSNVVNDYLMTVELSINIVSLSLTLFMFICLIATVYYLSFNLKKTVYQLPKTYYIHFFNINILKLLMTFCSSDNFVAIMIFEVFYIFVLVLFIYDLRKIALQQREHVHHSIFKVIKEKTGLMIIASTPSGLFSSSTNVINHYMIGFNKNIKTWLIFGVFVKMDKEGIYFKKVFITYNELVMFNNTFDKKIVSYNRNELATAIMYSI